MTKEEILAKNCHIEKHPHTDGKVVNSTIESVMTAMEEYKKNANAEECPKDWGEPEWEALPVGIQKAFGCLDYLKSEEELSDYGHERIASAIHALECDEYATQEKQGWVKTTLKECLQLASIECGFSSFEEVNKAISPHTILTVTKIAKNLYEKNKLESSQQWVKISDEGWPKINGDYLTKRVYKHNNRGWRYNESLFVITKDLEPDYRLTGWADVIEYKLIEELPQKPEV